MNSGSLTPPGAAAEEVEVAELGRVEERLGGRRNRRASERGPRGAGEAEAGRTGREGGEGGGRGGGDGDGVE